MPQIKPGHRLYLYRLLSRELGVGKQTALTRASQAIEDDGFTPSDLGFDDARALFEALGECVKLTVFKKGAVFVTVIANEEYDQALARAEKNNGKQAANTKSFKRGRGGKNIKPLKPKHVEAPAAQAASEPEPEPEPKPGAVPADAAEAARAPKPVMEPATEPTPEAEARAQAEAGAAPSPEPRQNEEQRPEDAGPSKSAASDASAAAASRPNAYDTHVPAETQAADSAPAADAPATEKTPANADGDASGAASPAEGSETSLDTDNATRGERSEKGRKDPGDAPAAPLAQPSEPSIHFTITYAPEPVEGLGTTLADDASQASAPAATAVSPAPAPRASRPANDLPQDFYADVRVTDEPLSALYQVLPHDVDPVAMLEEDFRIARSTGALKGTRSEVSFPLRFERKNGAPVTATLRRRARSVAGKRWTLTSIEADSPEEVGMGALEHKAAGPWAAFANEDQLKSAVSPEAELAQFAVLGSWDKLLDELAGLAAPEDWGEDRTILREYLSMTYRRIARQHRLSMADDGSGAAFDTGLVTAEGETIAAVLEPHDGDIAWELTCFSVNAQGQPATYLPHFVQPKAAAGRTAEATLDQLRRSASEATRSLRRALQQAIRNPRYATLAYDAVNDRVVGLLPVDDKVRAIVAGENGETQVVATVDAHDAYVCARVVSSEQPSWLVKKAKIGQVEG